MDLRLTGCGAIWLGFILGGCQEAAIPSRATVNSNKAILYTQLQEKSDPPTATISYGELNHLVAVSIDIETTSTNVRWSNWKYPSGWAPFPNGRGALVYGRAPMGSSRPQAPDALRMVAADVSVDGAPAEPIIYKINVQPYEQIQGYGGDSALKHTFNLNRAFPDPGTSTGGGYSVTAFIKNLKKGDSFYVVSPDGTVSSSWSTVQQDDPNFREYQIDLVAARATKIVTFSSFDFVVVFGSSPAHPQISTNYVRVHFD